MIKDHLAKTTMKYLIILCLSISCLFACKSKKKASREENVETKAQVAETTPIEENAASETYAMSKEEEKEYAIIQSTLSDSVFAQIQRTSCFGRCPTYTLTVYQSGYTTYFGKRWVEKEGWYATKVGDEVKEKLMKMANEISYFELNNFYDNPGITDLPSTITSMKGAEGFQTVVSRYETPKELITFERYFDSLFEKLKWEKIQQD